MIDGKNYLVTTDNWFYAPDGKKYTSAWGKCVVYSDDILKIKTNRSATNWYVKIGSEDNHIIVAGCQVHYSVRSEDEPNELSVIETTYGEGEGKRITRDSEIYIAQ